MALLEEADKRIVLRYSVKKLSFLLDEDEVELGFSNIMGIEYLNYYDENLMSVLKLILKMDIRRKLWLLKNRDDITVKLELVGVKFSPDLEQDDEVEVPFIDDEFVPFFNENDTLPDSESIINSFSEDPDPNLDIIDHDSYMNSEETIEIYLFKEDIIYSSRYVYNKIFKKETIQNMIGQMLTESEHEKVLMNKIQNEEEYTEFLVPCNPVFKCLTYIDNYFGFYESGALIFYDFDTLYILDLSMEEPIGKKAENCDEKDEDPEVNILIDTGSSTTPGRGIVQKDNDDKQYIILTESDINICKFSRTKEPNFGSKISLKVLNPETKLDEIDEENDFTAEIEFFGDERTERFINVDKENKFYRSALKARIEEDESVAYATTYGIDINYFTPNKVFKLIFAEEKKSKVYKDAKYRLSMVHHYIKPETEGHMECGTKFILKKCNGELHDLAEISSDEYY